MRLPVFAAESRVGVTPGRARVLAGLAVVALHLVAAFLLMAGIGVRHSLHASGNGLGEVDVGLLSRVHDMPGAPVKDEKRDRVSDSGATASEKRAAADPVSGTGAVAREATSSVGSSQEALVSPTGAASGAAEVDFGRVVLGHIEHNKRYPVSANGDRPSGTVRVLFTMTRDGAVSAVWVQSGSGSAMLDREAVATLLRSQPLPAIPADLPDRLNFSFDLEFSPLAVVPPQ